MNAALHLISEDDERVYVMDITKSGGDKLRFLVNGIEVFELDPDDCQKFLEFVAVFGGE